MKQVFGFLCITGLIYGCGSGDKQADQAVVVPAQTEKVSKHSAEFNIAYDTLLAAYFDLKDAFVQSDLSVVNATGTKLVAIADSFKLQKISFDSTGVIELTATDYLESLSENGAQMLAVKDLEAKRLVFETVSNIVFDLSRTIQYDNSKIYHQYCPMAFNDKGASWLSNSSEIKNPYFGDKMLGCGEVKDSLGF